MTYLFHLGCAAGVAGSDLQTELTYPAVGEVEAITVPISCQFSEIGNLPWAVKGSGADGVATARGKGRIQNDWRVLVEAFCVSVVGGSQVLQPAVPSF